MVIRVGWESTPHSQLVVTLAVTTTRNFRATAAHNLGLRETQRRAGHGIQGVPPPPSPPLRLLLHFSGIHLHNETCQFT